MSASTDWEPLFDVPTDEGEAHDSGRPVWLAFAGIALVLIAGILAAVIRYVDEGGGQSPAPLGPVPTVGGIGPGPGQAIGAYIDERKAALAALGEADRRVAVVTFVRYRSESETHGAIDEVLPPGSVEVLALLVAVAGDQPQVVTGSLADWAAAYRSNAMGERSEIEKLLPTVEPGSEWATFYTQELARLDAAVKGADPAAPMVYAVAVRGPVRALRVLAGTSTVRLVDVGASDAAPDGDVYRAPMPDEVSAIGDPQLRPVPVR